jgi:hypothetical protein
MSGWMIRGRVRVVADVTVGSVDPATSRTYRAGEVLDMILRGTSGQPLAAAAWWSTTDVDAAYILKADQVEVLDMTGPYWVRCGTCGAGGEIDRGEDGIPRLVTEGQRRAARVAAAGS